MGNQNESLSTMSTITEKFMDSTRFWDRCEWVEKAKRHCGFNSGVRTATHLCAGGHVSNIPSVRPTLLRLDSTGNITSDKFSSGKVNNEWKDMKWTGSNNVDNCYSQHFQHNTAYPMANQKVSTAENMEHNNNRLLFGMLDTRTMMKSSNSNFQFGMPQVNLMGMGAFPFGFPHYTQNQQSRVPVNPTGAGYCDGIWYNNFGQPFYFADNFVHNSFGPSGVSTFPCSQPAEASANHCKYNNHSSNIPTFNMKPNPMQTYMDGIAGKPNVFPSKSFRASQNKKIHMKPSDRQVDASSENNSKIKISPVAQMNSYPQTSSIDIKGNMGTVPTSVHSLNSQGYTGSASDAEKKSASARGLNVHAKVFHCRNNPDIAMKTPEEVLRVTVVECNKPVTENSAFNSVIKEPSSSANKSFAGNIPHQQAFHVTMKPASNVSTPCPIPNGPKMTPSSQKKKHRPSSKKRRRLKMQREGDSKGLVKNSKNQCDTQMQSQKRQKLKNDCFKAESSCSDSPGVNIVFGFEEDCQETHSDCVGLAEKNPVISAKFSFFVDSSPSDSDFSEVDWDEEEDEVDGLKCSPQRDYGDELWKSLQKECNPLSFHISYTVADDSASKSEIQSSPCNSIAGSPDGLEALNAMWNIKCTISPMTEPSTSIPVMSCDTQGSPKKKVSFAEGPSLVKVHPMVTWSHAYQAARKGPWEQYARDHSRFQDHIRDIEKNIGHVFQPEHREKIFQKLLLNTEEQK